jgi:large subunit ribosomal protein L17
MRHGVKKVKLGRLAAHRDAMLKNLATSVLRKGLEEQQIERQVRTTLPKAKAVRTLVDRLITYAKKGDLSARRQAARFVQEPEILQELFSKIGPRYSERPGGYTRILKLTDNRHGDNAEMALISLVDDELKTKSKKKPAIKKASKKVDVVESKPIEEPVAQPTAEAAEASEPDVKGAAEKA